MRYPESCLNLEKRVMLLASISRIPSSRMKPLKRPEETIQVTQQNYDLKTFSYHRLPVNFLNDGS